MSGDALRIVVAEMRECADSHITILRCWLRRFADEVESAALAASATPQRGEAVARIVVSEATDGWVDNVELLDAGKKLPPGEYELHTTPQRTDPPAEGREGVECIWPDCGHDTNCSDSVSGCNGKFCPRSKLATESLRGGDCQLSTCPTPMQCQVHARCKARPQPEDRT